MKIDMSQLITAEEKLVSSTAIARNKSISRAEFCNAIAAHGVVNDSEAIAGARGEWPAPMKDFLDYLDTSQARDVQIEWASCATIERMHPFVLILGSWLQMTDKELDTIFDIQIPIT